MGNIEQFLNIVEKQIIENNKLISNNCIEKESLYDLELNIAITQLSKYCIEKEKEIKLMEVDGVRYLSFQDIN